MVYIVSYFPFLLWNFFINLSITAASFNSVLVILTISMFMNKSLLFIKEFRNNKLYYVLSIKHL